MRFTTTTRDTKHRTHWFTVTGSGVFPIDMLRFDLAWPASSEDAALIVGHDFGYTTPDGTPRQKRSIRMGCAQFYGPTIDRWRSFGWSVGDEDRGEVG